MTEHIYSRLLRPRLKSIYLLVRGLGYRCVDTFFRGTRPVAVIGCGRSGTNMVLEILSGHKAFRPTTPDPEDKRFFVRGRRFPQGFLTKCDTHYGSIDELRDLLALNSKMKIVWTIRDPRDICLSKLRRGVTIEEGGDCDTPADDSTDDGCVDSIYKMFEMYRFIVSKFPERIYLIKMEDVLSKLEEEVCSLASFLKIDFEPAMLDFSIRVRNPKKENVME